MGRFSDAEKHFTKAITILTALSDSVNPDLTLSIQEQKADLYAKFDKNQEALRDYTVIMNAKKTKAMASQNDQEKLEVASLQDKIGRVLAKMEDYEGALNVFDEAIKTKSQILGPNDAYAVNYANILLIESDPRTPSILFESISFSNLWYVVKLQRHSMRRLNFSLRKINSKRLVSSAGKSSKLLKRDVASITQR